MSAVHWPGWPSVAMVVIVAAAVTIRRLLDAPRCDCPVCRREE